MQRLLNQISEGEVIELGEVGYSLLKNYIQSNAIEDELAIFEKIVKTINKKHTVGILPIYDVFVKECNIRKL